MMNWHWALWLWSCLLFPGSVISPGSGSSITIAFPSVVCPVAAGRHSQSLAPSQDTQQQWRWTIGFLGFCIWRSPSSNPLVYSSPHPIRVDVMDKCACVLGILKGNMLHVNWIVLTFLLSTVEIFKNSSYILLMNLKFHFKNKADLQITLLLT